MRIAFVADVHGNLEALEAVLAETDRERLDQIYCLGDLVGYGADPQACIEIIRSRAIPTVAGNHDRAACGLLKTTYFNEEAARSLEWTCAALSDEQLDYLRGLPLTLQTETLSLGHASLANPAAFDYIMGAQDAYRCFHAHDRRLAFMGHSHVAAAFLLAENEMLATVDERFVIPCEMRAIINVGAVGQPRDGVSRAAYALFDTDSGELASRRVEYDVERAARKILAAGLPPANALRLAAGR